MKVDHVFSNVMPKLSTSSWICLNINTSGDNNAFNIDC